MGPPRTGSGPEHARRKETRETRRLWPFRILPQWHRLSMDMMGRSSIEMKSIRYRTTRSPFAGHEIRLAWHALQRKANRPRLLALHADNAILLACHHRGKEP